MSIVELLTHADSAFHDTAAFLVPRRSDSGKLLEEWYPVTFHEVALEADKYARYWSSILSADGVQKRDVVALWIIGYSYGDVIQFLALLKAGYIPQLIPGSLSDIQGVYGLMAASGAKALIHDPSLGPTTDSSLHVHEIREITPEDAIATSSALPEHPALEVAADDIEAIFHTSGSTGNLPKLVRLTRRWVERATAKSVAATPETSTQHVLIWLGSMAHVSQLLILLTSLKRGVCTVQPVRFPYFVNDFLIMYKGCKVNHVEIFAPLLALFLRESRQNPELRAAMASLAEIGYTGASIPLADLEWAEKEGMKLQSSFGNSECAALMRTANGTADPAPHLFRPLDGVKCSFVPVEGSSTLLELVILSDSPECPDASFRSPVDGHFHTGDLFEEPVPGRYEYRGRDDDWIKLKAATRCNTKDIEDQIRATCRDIVADCVVVGSGRPYPSVFVELRAPENDEATVKHAVVDRLKDFNSGRYKQERISSEDLVFVVRPGLLPKTAKGNIRRKAVEELYRDALDRAYDAM